MPTDRDDDKWGRDDLDRPSADDETPSPSREAARARTGTPGTLLVLIGFLLLGFLALNVAVLASGYDLSVAMLEYMKDMQPDAKAKDQMQVEIDKAKARDRSIDYIQGVVFSLIGLVMDCLIIYGGLKMRAVRGYEMALVGAVCAIIPLNSCCCLAMPIGIWAVMVLMNADVKAAFRSPA